MKIRPIFIYSLMIAVGLVFLMAIGGNVMQVRALQQADPILQTIEIGVIKQEALMDTGRFLSVVDEQAELLNIQLQGYQSSALSDLPGNRYDCQLVMQGTFENVVLLLGWVEKQEFVQEVSQFSMIGQDNKAETANRIIQLTIDLVLK